MKNKVVFAGAGPGAPDLMTLRCLNAIKNADVIIYTGSLISEEVKKLFRYNCKTYDSAKMILDDIIDLIERRYNEGKNVLRLHSGDPSMYGTLIEQFNRLDKSNIEYEVIPGVSSVFASAAALKTELTVPAVSQTVILTRNSGRTPVPPEEALEKLACHNATMAIFLSIKEINEVVNKLICGGYSGNTPAAVVYRATWPDEKIIRGTLSNISESIKKKDIKNQGMIIVGNVLARKGEVSGLYHEAFAHGFREADRNAILPDYLVNIEKKNNDTKVVSCKSYETAIYSLTENGLTISKKISKELGACHIFASSKFRSNKKNKIRFFDSTNFKNLVRENWVNYKNHIFIMAMGITIRVIAPLMTSKLTDPAIVCCDDMENYAVSLISGHIGGANRLAEKISEFTKYKPVITTASDVRALNSIDEFASLQNWIIENPKNIKYINNAFIEGNPVSLLCENKAIAANLQAYFPAFELSNSLKLCKSKFVVAMDQNIYETDKKVLWIKTAQT